jgi:hypothetical protein
MIVISPPGEFYRNAGSAACISGGEQVDDLGAHA